MSEPVEGTLKNDDETLITVVQFSSDVSMVLVNDIASCY